MRLCNNTKFIFSTVTLANFQCVLKLLQEENANSSVLGTMLGVEGTVTVPADQLTCAAYLTTVLKEWKKGNKKGCEYTWEVLKSALTSCSYGALVQQMSGRTGSGKVTHSMSNKVTLTYFCFSQCGGE